MSIIGFTGTQKGMTSFQKDTLKEILLDKKCSEFHFGDCIGSDAEACDIAIECGVEFFTIHPPKEVKKRAWKFDSGKHTAFSIPIKWMVFISMFGSNIRVRWRLPLPYMERNQNIVNETNLLIATPKEHTMTMRSGTWSTIRKSWKLKKEVIIIPPIIRDE